MGNRAERRAAKAMARHSSPIVAAKSRKVATLQRQVEHRKAELRRLDAELRSLQRVNYDKLNDIVDLLSAHASDLTDDDNDIERSATKAMQDWFTETSANCFVRNGYHKANEDNVRQIIHDEVVARCNYRGDVAIALAIVDRIAMEADAARARGESPMEAAHRAYVAAGQGQHSYEVAMRARLAEVRWRGVTEETFEDVIVSSVLNDLDEHARIAKEFPWHEYDGQLDSGGAFARRLNAEYKQVIATRELTWIVDDVANRNTDAIVKAIDTCSELEEAIRRCTLGLKNLARVEDGADDYYKEMRPALLRARWLNCTEQTVDVLVAERFVRSVWKKSEQFREILTKTKVVASKLTVQPEGRISLTQRTIDHVLMRIGAQLWSRTYAKEMDDTKAEAVCAEDLRLDPPLGHFAALWAVQAFQRMQTSHTFASALMCTEIDRESVASIQEQWRAWSVMVPNGMLCMEEDGKVFLECTRILTWVTPSVSRMQMFFFSPAGMVGHEDFEAATLPDLLAGQTKPGGEQIGRLEQCAKRLVAGLLLTMQNVEPGQVKEVPAKNPLSKREEGAPAHRIITIGKPIKIDCREALKNYIATGHARAGGTRSLPKVQWLVRGHWRNQPYGPRRLGRRRQWISPFWKGVADAPILSRGKVLT